MLKVSDSEISILFPLFINFNREIFLEIGYRGFLTIEREVGEDPEKDIRAAASFLTNLTRG